MARLPQHSHLRFIWNRCVRRREGCFSLIRQSPLLRDAGVLLVIVCLIAQIWLPARHLAAMALVGKMTPYAQVAGFLDDSSALCSGQNWDGRGRPASPENAPPRKTVPCPICQAAQSMVSLAPPLVVFSLAEVRQILESLAPRREAFVARIVHSIPQSRAPPIMV